MGSDGNRVCTTSSAVVLVGTGGSSLVSSLLSGLGTSFTCIGLDSTMIDDPIRLKSNLLDIDYTIDSVKDYDLIGRNKPMSQRPYVWYQKAFKKGKRRW